MKIVTITLAAVAALTFGGCDYAKALTDAEGKPLVPPQSGSYCVTLSDGGRMCYTEPPVAPPPPPLPPLQLTK